MARLGFLALLFCGLDAAARCKAVNRCECGSAWPWAARLAFRADGGPRVVEVFTGDGGTDHGPTAEELASYGGLAGSEIIATAGKPSEGVPIDAHGLVHCEQATFEASHWGTALGNGTCGELLRTHGVADPPCLDHCGCGASGLAPALGFALLAFARTRGRPLRRPSRDSPSRPHAPVSG